MVRKIALFCLLSVLMLATAGRAKAESYTAYEGNLNNTYLGYFRDTVSSVRGDYVAWRNDQNEYCLFIGDLSIDFSVVSGTGKLYSYKQESFTGMGAGQDYSYTVTDDDSFSVDLGSEIAYSSLGDYPRLIDERGESHAYVQIIILSALFVYIVVHDIFEKSIS